MRTTFTAQPRGATKAADLLPGDVFRWATDPATGGFLQLCYDPEEDRDADTPDGAIYAVYTDGSSAGWIEPADEVVRYDAELSVSERLP